MSSRRPAELPSSAVDVGVHIYESTTFRVRVGSSPRWASLRLVGSGGEVVVFAARADWNRLHAAIGELITALDAAHATADASRDAAGPGAA